MRINSNGRGGIIFLAAISMISFDTYKILPRDLQAGVLLQRGVYLELIRETAQLNIELYSLNDFYVEVYFNNQTGGSSFYKGILFSK